MGVKARDPVLVARDERDLGVQLELPEAERDLDPRAPELLGEPRLLSSSKRARSSIATRIFLRFVVAAVFSASTTRETASVR